MGVTKIAIGAILLGTIHPVSALAVNAEHATAAGPLANHDDAVINTFQVMCTLEPENFERISATAQAMSMRKSTDKTEKQTADITRHVEVFEGNSHHWSLQLASREDQRSRYQRHKLRSGIKYTGQTRIF